MKKNTTDKLITTAELAGILGVSRIAVFKMIQRGKIFATKVGRSYVINKEDVSALLGKKLSEKTKKDIETAVKKVVKEYNVALKLLGQE